MLNAKELKEVVTTLSKRRAWLRKNLDDSSVSPKQKAEFKESLSLLDSAHSKLTANVAAAPAKPKPKTPTVEVSKPSKIEHTRVLIAEDSEESAELLMGLLHDVGIRAIDHAKDGIEAFDFIKKSEPYHIILCDWDMPELSGIEVHSKAKASNTLRGAHFVMVTGVTDAPRIRQAVQQGINDYIVKPIDVDKLEAKISAAVGIDISKKAG